MFKNITVSDIVKVGSIFVGFAFFTAMIQYHIDNREIHHSLNELTQVFVPRSEYDIIQTQLKDEIKDIKILLSKMNDKIDAIVLKEFREKK